MNLDVKVDEHGNVIRKDRRPTAAVMAVVAVLALGYCMFSKSWLVNHESRYMKVSAGLLSIESCYRSDCKTISNAELIAEIKEFREATGQQVPGNGAWPTLGYVTMGLLGVTIVGLLGLLSFVPGAKPVAAGKFASWPVAPSTIAVVGSTLALIIGCIFVAMKPGGKFAIGVGFFVFGLGTILAMGASILMAKELAIDSAAELPRATANV